MTQQMHSVERDWTMLLENVLGHGTISYSGIPQAGADKVGCHATCQVGLLVC